MARKRGLRGLRALKSGGMASYLVPVGAGLVLTVGGTVGIRAVVNPGTSPTAAKVYRWAPAIGTLLGVLGSAALHLLAGMRGSATAGLTSVGAGLGIMGLEALNARKAGAYAAIGGSTMPGALPSGTGAVVPEYGTRGVKGIIMRQLNGNQQGQGETVTLRGTVDTGAFGRRTA